MFKVYFYLPSVSVCHGKGFEAKERMPFFLDPPSLENKWVEKVRKAIKTGFSATFLYSFLSVT